MSCHLGHLGRFGRFGRSGHPGRSGHFGHFGRFGRVLLALGLLALGGAASAADTSAPAATWERQLESDGVTTRLRLEALDGAGLRPGAPVRLRVGLSSTLDGTPIARTLPGVWIDGADPRLATADAAEAADACRQRIGRYVRASSVNPQALTDLNGYDVLALNADPSISVLDPRTRFAGRTSLRATLPLPGPGFDWAATADDTRLFVSVPSRRALAVLDLLALKAAEPVALPGAPGRVRLHPGGTQVWVGVAEGGGGTDGKDGGKDGAAPVTTPGGVAIVPVAPPHRPTWLPLGHGHVDMAFDPAGWVAVTQRDAARVIFVDPVTLRIERSADLPAGALPLAVAFDAQARRFIVAEARSGRLLAFDHRGKPLPDLMLAAGIGPLSISTDGRWLFAANPAAQAVFVVDLPAWRVAHRLPVSGRPFEVAQTTGYAYIRALDTEAITLVALASLADAPRPQVIGMGERPPGRTPNLPIAAQIAPMADGMGSFVASPGDNAVYYYMEGMNAAAGSVSARGHEVRAVRLARRGLREVAAGEFEQQFRLPEVAQLLLAVATDSPRTQHCVALALAAAPDGATAPWQLAWEQLPERSARLVLRLDGVPPGQQPERLLIRLFQPGYGSVDVEAQRDDVGHDSADHDSAGHDNASHDSTGRYSAELPALAAGLWYAHPQPPGGSGARWNYVSFVRKGSGS